MLLIFLALIGKIVCLTHHLLLTPLDHPFCEARQKNRVMNRLTIDYKELSIIIEPNISSSSYTSTNTLCPVTILQSSSRLIKESFSNGREIGYWYLTMKISGDFSSCANFIGFGELNSDFNESEKVFVEKYGEKLNCRSKMPIIIHSQYRQIAIWWMWSKSALPRIRIDVISYLRYVGEFDIEQKRNICTHVMGFWCGEICIDGRMRCDGVDDCIIIMMSQTHSADELNCQNYRNSSETIGHTKNDPTNESFWISNILYILLCLVGLILIASACKICITSSLLSKRLRSKKKSSITNSPQYSISNGESDVESPYEDIYMCSESDSKRNSSLNISGDEETQEELLAASKEYIDKIYNNNVFHPQLVSSKMQDETLKSNKLPPPIQLHSLSSYRLQDCSSSITSPTNMSITGNILQHGQKAISEMNSPGSTRTFRKIFSNNINKTSSYDKILMHSDVSSNSSQNEEVFKTYNNNNKPKSHTISRLENNRPNDHYDGNDGFTTYVIV